MIKYAFNCWKSLKPTKLQHRDEINSGVSVAKAEKISWMLMRSKPLLNEQWEISSQVSKRERFNDYPNRSRAQASGVRKGAHPKKGEDIVCTLLKNKEVLEWRPL